VITPEEIESYMFFTTDCAGRIVCYALEQSDNPELLGTLREWDKELLTPEEMKTLLINVDENGQTVWHAAAWRGNLFGTLWEWAKELITPDEIKKHVFLTKDNIGRTIWHAAAERGRLGLLCKLWEWDKELLTQEEIKKLVPNQR
jgi:hypothetical protein